MTDIERSVGGEQRERDCNERGIGKVLGVSKD